MRNIFVIRQIIRGDGKEQITLWVGGSYTYEQNPARAFDSREEAVRYAKKMKLRGEVDVVNLAEAKA